MNKIKTIDLFAGCGGLTEGFAQTGKYETRACVEWEKSSRDNLAMRLETKYKLGDAQSRVVRFDIQRTNELIKGFDDPDYGCSEGLDKIVDGTIDMIIGGPPCQAYSVAGRIRDENGMRDDYRNYLFESYLKVVKHFKPKAFIFENVPGILSAKPDGRPIVDRIIEQFNNAGYAVVSDFSKAVVDAKDFGVPQNRKRVIILGLRKKEFGEKSYEMLEKFYKEILPGYHEKKVKTVRDAISDLPKLYPLEDSSRKSSHSVPENNVSNHYPRWHSKRDIGIFRTLAEDIESGKDKYSTIEARKELYTQQTGKTSNIHKYNVLKWDEPSNTIPAHLQKDGLRHIHPDSEQARTITVREAARLQTFPDDYEFIGAMTDQYRMIGNAVPPELARRIALAVYDLVFGG